MLTLAAGGAGIIWGRVVLRRPLTDLCSALHAAPLAAGGAGSSADVTALPPPPQPTSSFGRLLQRMGLGGGGEVEGAGTKLIAGKQRK